MDRKTVFALFVAPFAFLALAAFFTFSFFLGGGRPCL